MSTVISVENIGKKYNISHQVIGDNYSLRDTITNCMVSLSDKLFRPLNSKHGQVFEEFWALRDVSFDVKMGERIGIIGRNGAGKSTLLKILSRITEPTTGSARIKGRVSSLLEVGTGFHPELTGRENIFLNGAILGMCRHEIKNKFEEIVDFSEIEKFLDTPVKRYSSGMYLRLAFAVAAHLEPEILIVDEVLAVGDAAFQKKCLGKMEDIGSEGRTVLFVSHNLGAIRSICNRVVWLMDGCLHDSGDVVQISERYIKQNLHITSDKYLTDYLATLPQDPLFQLEKIAIYQCGALTNTFLNGEQIELEIIYRVFESTLGLRVYFDLCDEEGNILIRSFCDELAESISMVKPGLYSSRAIIPADLLAPRTYALRLGGTIHNVRSVPPDGIVITINIENSNGINRCYPNEPIRSKLLPKICWSTVNVD